ncbi:hypothetical protein LUZ61_019289 [Rhynchospora tenuis]|uniref:Hexosyltransferase n=1 Tax=Rhynchospora tenuis TaxID=198213 RepID=A0AAD5ZB40_9POAL|nr:hypothetical protein LUZ61_019289 [Rhynchospora tenuis]
MEMRDRGLLSVVTLLLLALAALSSGGAVAASEEAYVTLLYGDQFVLGARVLGKSLRDTGTTKDLVALVSDGVSTYAQDLLSADGWKVQKISLLTNPNPKSSRPKRFWGVYTKLKIFSLTQYKKVVYLDADTIVVKSIEDLFKCGKFCANLKHSERLNSGVLVVEPSEALFKDMMDKVAVLPSYTGGDQGFLNSYYADFPNAHLFDPSIPEEVVQSKPEPETQRLTTLYNADVGLYMLANKWMVEEKELRIIHYTLGPLKPWDWYTAWLIKPVEVWQEIRNRVEASLPGTGGGKNPHDQHIVFILFLLPFFVLIPIYYRTLIQAMRDLSGQGTLCVYGKRLYHQYKSGTILPVYSSVATSSSSSSHPNQMVRWFELFTDKENGSIPPLFGHITSVAWIVSLGTSLGVAFMLIPLQVTPGTGLLLLYELTFTSFFLLFNGYLRLVHRWGSAVGNRAGHDDPSGKGHQRYILNSDAIAMLYWIIMALLAIFAPLWPILLGVSSLFAKLGMMVAGGVVLAIFMDHATVYLAKLAFIKGKKSSDLARS